MLTDRQQQILHLIVQLYGEFEEPIGSKTLLQQSYLDVSSATIRNEMLTLERQGYLLKAHSSSGRIPSFNGYRHYIKQLIDHKDIPLNEEDELTFKELFRDRQYNALQQAQLVADILATATGNTAVVWAQNNEMHKVQEFRLIHLTDYSVIAILLTDHGAVESQLFDLLIGLSKETIQRIASIINDEVRNLSLEEATQRMKLMIPLLLQRQISYQVDFLPLFEKMMHQLKGNHYMISGKHNLFDMMDMHTNATTFKQIFSFVDGSSEMYRLLEQQEEGIEVLFGVEMIPNGLANINMITGTYYQQNQKIVMGLIGPHTMQYARIIGLLAHIIEELSTH